MRGPLLSIVAAANFVVASGARAADTPGPADGPTPDASTSSGTAQADHHDVVSDYLAGWMSRVERAQASQPHWITPIATVTPRLEQEFRYDQFWQTTATGVHTDNYDGGKGLELIPTTSNEVIVNLPPYIVRDGKKAASGFNDWPFLLVKQRLLSANEQNGNYIVTAFFSVQAPTGITALTNGAWVITPTLAAGKGWGDFDIQATVGVPIPLQNESIIGTSLATNVAFQYHLGKVLWPEFEINTVYWFDGLRGGTTQIFLTPGLVLGRFPFGGRVKGIVGLGYQIAVSPTLTTVPVLTPMYDHGVILTSRLTF